jgi:uncharacterized protein (TIGR00661 family)
MQTGYKLNRILICPLDWGLGHATRCIPIIKKYIEEGCEVMIAADGRSLELLQKEFPHLKFIRFPGYNISYSESISMALQMLLSSAKILWKIYQEHQKLKKILEDHQIDLIISDNRYGLWNKNVRSIFMTHQIMIKSTGKLKFLEPVLYRINQWFIKHYDECWIPDYEGEDNLSGDLSHLYPVPKNAKFIGPLSRLAHHQIPSQREDEIELLIILSGPEPQRTILENKIINQLRNIKIKTVIVRGIPGSNDKLDVPYYIAMYSHLATEKMREAISNAKIIICRSGYSSIMDLAVLNKKAIFIPTPGQTEQEYLAKYHTAKKKSIYYNQNEFYIEKVLSGDVFKLIV